MREELSPEKQYARRATVIIFLFVIGVVVAILFGSIVLPQYQAWRELRTEHPLTNELGRSYEFPDGWRPVFAYGQYGANFICVNNAGVYRDCVPNRIADDD